MSPAAPWTSPEPFLSPASNPVSYYGRYFEEVMVEVSDQASALGLSAPVWHRYLSPTEREEITPNLGSSLVGYDYSYVNYITNIRAEYENQLFSAWGITKKEYLEGKYSAGQWPSSTYDSWVHSAGALSQDGDLYDRDLDELRSYKESPGFTVKRFEDRDLDGEGDLAMGGSQYIAPGDTRVGVGDGSVRAIMAVSLGDINAPFLANFKFIVSGIYGSQNPSSLGNVIVEHIKSDCPSSLPCLTDYGASALSEVASISPANAVATHNLDVLSAINNDLSANYSYCKFRIRTSAATNYDAGADLWVISPDSQVAILCLS